MQAEAIAEALRERFESKWFTIDSHTAGEQTRLIIGGIGALPGETMAAKREHFISHYDEARQILTREPRGNRGIMGVYLTEPTTSGAAFGVIFMDARRYPYLCGHAVIGTVATLIEAGVLDAEDGERSVVVDTPSGPMHTSARVKKRRVDSVAIRMVPSFVYGRDQAIELAKFGRLTVDTVCVGGFFVMVSADQIDADLSPANSDALAGIGMALIDAANEQLVVKHPLRPEVRTVDVVEFYDPSNHTRYRGSNMVVYGEAHVDRSPCGTGTAAKMTLLHSKGHLPVEQVFVNCGPLGTRFEGRIVAETSVGGLPAVETEIRGNAQITGIHEFVLDSHDPFQQGFIL